MIEVLLVLALFASLIFFVNLADKTELPYEWDKSYERYRL